MKGIVELEIPKSCLLCPFFGGTDSVGFWEFVTCKLFGDTLNTYDMNSDNSFEYRHERYPKCPIKPIKEDTDGNNTDTTGST